VVPVPISFTSDFAVLIDEDTLDGCPIFCGRVIRGVKNGPSPDWLQQALRAIGLRPISFLVDVTNFFTMDRNRPLHVFDADKLSGNLRVHRAQGGEEIAALDEKTYQFSEGQMVISDDSGAQSIAGIMAGLTRDAPTIRSMCSSNRPIGTQCRLPMLAVRCRLILMPATDSSAEWIQPSLLKGWNMRFG